MRQKSTRLFFFFILCLSFLLLLLSPLSYHRFNQKASVFARNAEKNLTRTKAAKKAITVKWKKGKKAQVTGYQVMVATNSKFTKNKKTATVKGYTKVSKKMTGLKAKTKYYVKVRTYKTVKGVKIYSNWSKVKTLKTK